MPTVFNARAAHGMKLDKTYRVYFRRDTLFFIYIGEQDWTHTGAQMFGALGALIALMVKKGTEKKRQEQIAALDRQDPELLLTQNTSNFKLSSPEIQSATLRNRSMWSQHGPHCGKCEIVWVNGKKLQLELVTKEDMHAISELLPPLLGSRLQVKVQWDPNKKRFVSIKNA